MIETSVHNWTKLGSAIRDARKGRSWSQQTLAHRAGVSRSWLARLEAGHRGAELEQIFRVLRALDLVLTLHDRTESHLHGPTPPSIQGRSDDGAAALLSAHESATSARREAWGVHPEGRPTGAPTT